MQKPALLRARVTKSTGAWYKLITDEGHLVEAGLDVFRVMEDGNVGIAAETTQNAQVNVYPNPFVSELQVSLSELPTDNYTFQLFDMYGRILFEQKTAANEMTVKRQNWPTGMYYYSIVNDETETIATGKIFLKFFPLIIDKLLMSIKR